MERDELTARRRRRRVCGACECTRPAYCLAPDTPVRVTIHTRVLIGYTHPCLLERANQGAFGPAPLVCRARRRAPCSYFKGLSNRAGRQARLPEALLTP